MKKFFGFLFMLVVFTLVLVVQAVAQSVGVDPSPEPIPWYQNWDKIGKILLWIFGSTGLLGWLISVIPTGTPLPKWLRWLSYVGKLIVFLVENLIVKDRKKGGGTHNIVKLEEEVVPKELSKGKSK